MILRTVLIAVALGAASAAGAASIPVAYSVDFKEYKRAESGDALDFEIFADDACTTLLHSETLFAGDPGLRQEKVLSQKVKNQSPKPPLEMRLKTTLVVASPVSSAYLRVTGDHVIPVGGSCQVLFDVPASAERPWLYMVDAEGDAVGPMYDAETVILDMAGVPNIAVGLTNGQLAGGGSLYYTTPDCSGPPLMSNFSDPFVRAGTLSLYVAPTSVTTQTVQSRSLGHDRTSLPACNFFGTAFVPPAGCCNPAGFSADVGPPTVYDMSDVLLPTGQEVR